MAIPSDRTGAAQAFMLNPFMFTRVLELSTTLTHIQDGGKEEQTNEVARKKTVAVPGETLLQAGQLQQRQVAFLSITSNPSRSQLDSIFLSLPRKPFGAGWVSGTLGVLHIRPGGLRHGGRISTQSLSLGTAELALWPHVQFIKLVCIFQGTGFPGRLGLNTASSQEFLRELLSTDRSALHILCAPVKFGTGILLLLQDQILEFYFINILSL